MTREISIAELQRRDVALQPDEVVAIVQQVIALSGCADVRDLKPPFGPPSPSNVYLKPDGTVACDSCHATLAVSEAAGLLHELLPRGSHVAGSLRYAIARALLEVDAPPFDSLDEFSATLARHERGDRAAIVRGLVERATARTGGRLRAAERTPSPFDRRRSSTSTADLRRELRDADARVYDQQRAIDALSAMTKSAPEPRLARVAVIVCGCAIGLSLVGLGEGVHMRRTVEHAASPPAVSAAPAPADAVRAAPPPVVAATDVELSPTPTPKPVVKRASHVRRREPHESSPGVLRRLHLQWLSKKIVLRSDPL